LERKIKDKIKGFRTQDGAGVSLVRILGKQTTHIYDPILMLDSFDSLNPDDYTKGFPMHPHRGIETISYVYQGKMIHKDSIGNEDAIGDGEVQWMTAGSGIFHEETLPASKRMLGVQLWLNLPAKNKMVAPQYFSIKNHEIKEIEEDFGKIRLLAGQYKDYKGYIGKYLPLDYYDIHLNELAEAVINTHKDKSILLFTLVGDVFINNELIEEKIAVKLSQGDKIRMKNLDKKAQVLYISSDFLNEPIAWGGPIVMNTKEELKQAFEDIDNGTFLKENITYTSKMI